MNVIFTLIIASQDVFEKFDTYYAFIQPILNSPDIALCKWNPTGETIDEALPSLSKLLEGKESWRAILIQDDEKMALKLNPFDYVPYFEKTPARPDREYFKKRCEARCENIQKAVKFPYVHLSLLLGGVPKFSEYVIHHPSLMTDDEYHYLNVERDEKVKIQKKLEDELLFPFKRPDELILMSRRLRLEDSVTRKIKVAWQGRYELDYSRFAENNMYPDCGRFLVYDTVDIKHAEYKKEYFGFVMANMILGMNSMFFRQMQAYKLYKYECHIDSAKLGKALALHQSQLLTAQAVVLQEQKHIETQMQQKVHGMDLKDIIALNESIPIEDSMHNFDELLASYKEIGLACDCPVQEKPYWENQYIQIKTTLPLYLKGPKRAVREGIRMTHYRRNLDTESLPLLDDFLLEDLKESIQENEMKMEQNHAVDLSNIKELSKAIDDAGQEIRDCMHTRMRRSTTLWIPFISIILFCSGMLPTLLKSFSETGTASYYFLFMLMGSSMIAFVAYIILFVFRGKLISKFKKFNSEVIRMDQTISDSLKSYSVYLSSMSNCMRGYSYWFHLKNHSSLYQKQLEQLERHLIEILRRLENCKYWIRDFSLNHLEWFETESKCSLDLSIQPEENCYYQVDMAEKGTTAPVNGNDYWVDIPYEFIDHITVEREEVFDD